MCIMDQTVWLLPQLLEFIDYHHNGLSAFSKSFECSEQTINIVENETRKNGTSFTVIFLCQLFLSFSLFLGALFFHTKVVLMTQ